MYGAVAQLERNDDEAKADFHKEIAAHPDNPLVVFALTALEAKGGDSLAARQTLRQFLDHHPENQQASLYLASLQTTALDYAGALKTLEAASAQNPDDRSTRVQISATLVHLHRNEEAAAAAKSALDGADDPGVLNDAAYELSETGIDLPVAEASSRKSIDKLEEKSATMAAAEANSRTFAEANLLIASWDTLGWVLFREDKLDQAQPLLSAAWRASLRAEVGDHLGQVDEALGKKDEALTVYSLAATALTKNDTPDVRGHIKDSITRLTAAGAKLHGSTGTDELQNMRTYYVPKASGAGGWGTFRLEITTAGVIDSQQMSGEKQIATLKTAIDAMKFPELLPPGSKAHLLRSAVVSCSTGSSCEVVLVPDGGLQTEQQ
jgi:tetratricopeptide (TPR) repeat protein